jgi:hypothetical protein
MFVLNLPLPLLPPTHISPSFSYSYSSSFSTVSSFFILLLLPSFLPSLLCLVFLHSILLLPPPFLLFFFSFSSAFNFFLLTSLLFLQLFLHVVSSLLPGPLQFRIYFWHYGTNSQFSGTPWMGERSIARPLAARSSNTSTETTCTYPTLKLGCELKISMFEWALDHVVTLIGESGNWMADVGCNERTCRSVVAVLSVRRSAASSRLFWSLGQKHKQENKFMSFRNRSKWSPDEFPSINMTGKVTEHLYSVIVGLPARSVPLRFPWVFCLQANVEMAPKLLLLAALSI